MVVDIIFLLGSLFLSIMFSILSAFDFFLPDNFIAAIQWAFGYIYYVDLILPVVALMEAFGVLLTFLAFWFSFKRILLPLFKLFKIKLEYWSD